MRLECPTRPLWWQGGSIPAGALAPPLHTGRAQLGPSRGHPPVSPQPRAASEKNREPGDTAGHASSDSDTSQNLASVPTRKTGGAGWASGWERGEGARAPGWDGDHSTGAACLPTRRGAHTCSLPPTRHSSCLCASHSDGGTVNSDTVITGTQGLGDVRWGRGCGKQSRAPQVTQSGVTLGPIGPTPRIRPRDGKRTRMLTASQVGPPSCPPSQERDSGADTPGRARTSKARPWVRDPGLREPCQ